MTRNLFYVLGLFAFMSLQTVHAQENTQTTIDSLKQAVNNLSLASKEDEANALDKKIWKDRAKYFNIGYVNQSLSSDVEERKSSMGVAMSWGRTYYLHKKPILGMIKIGLDWTWLDMSYVKYKDANRNGDMGYSKQSMRNSEWGDDEWGDDDWGDDEFPEKKELNLGGHQFDIGMQIGPSITVNPINHLKVSTYFRFAPSFSGIIDNDELNSSYVSFFTFGGAVSYKVISLGMEGRWGKANYGSLGLNDENETRALTTNGDGGWGDMINKSVTKLKSTSFRVYVSFRY